jgi:hypothetical protein
MGVDPISIVSGAPPSIVTRRESFSLVVVESERKPETCDSSFQFCRPIWDQGFDIDPAVVDRPAEFVDLFDRPCPERRVPVPGISPHPRQRR